MLRGSLAALLIALPFAATCGAAEISVKGSLSAPADSALSVVSTDPVVHNVLEEDFEAAKRSPSDSSGKSVTVTVTVNQRVLQPGVSLQDLSPGTPDVVDLLKAAGAEVPALADTGDSSSNPYENALRVDAQQYQTSQVGGMARSADPLRHLGAFPSYAGHDPSPYDNIPASVIYDSAIIFHATLSGAQGNGEFTGVAVVHPNESARQVKEIMAERIANQLLH